MAKKKKFPEIHPSIVKDQHGKNVEVYLTYNEFESIFEEMNFLKKKIAELKKKKAQKKAV